MPIDIDAANSCGATAAFRAAEENRAQCLEVLHNSGADLRVSAGGLLPIHVAAMNGALSAVQYLLNTERAMLTLKTLDGESPLHLAAGEGHDSVLRVMMALHAHLDATTAAAAWLDPHGATPVHVAAMCGQQASLRVFAECGVDLAARDREGLTPSDLARVPCSVFILMEFVLERVRA
eukprot:m.207575 g.207575  ORF g.207575 m.207575 type:complete len:178 (-) comp15543_c0_seq20:212-745(-)